MAARSSAASRSLWALKAKRSSRRDRVELVAREAREEVSTPPVVRLGVGVDRFLPEDAVNLRLQPSGGVLVEGGDLLGRLSVWLLELPHVGADARDNIA